MKVIKSLNNNMVLVCDAQGNDCICQGKGIGWQKRQGDTIDESCIERRFIPANADESRHFQQLFSEIPDAFWKIAEDVVAYADQQHQALLTKLVKAQHEIDSITATENFILGFRLGIRMMIECMDDNDGDIRNGG